MPRPRRRSRPPSPLRRRRRTGTRRRRRLRLGRVADALLGSRVAWRANRSAPAAENVASDEESDEEDDVESVDDDEQDDVESVDADALGEAAHGIQPEVAPEGPPVHAVPHGEAPSGPATGSTKKRKCRPSLLVQEHQREIAMKRAKRAAERALGPIQMAPQGNIRPFVPLLMPPNLFADDDPGERWAAHSAFSPSNLLVSSYGRVRLGNQHDVGGYDIDTGTTTPHGYRCVAPGGKKRRVHILVCEAFHGPKPHPNCSPDHIAKYGGDFVRERSDNRACNLKWSTPKEQRANQNPKHHNSTGLPVYARLVSSSNEADWYWYTSATAAGKALNLKAAAIRNTCRNQQRHTGGYAFKYDTEALETQDDLPPIPEDPNREEWRMDPKSNNRCLVSTRGRVQTQNPRGGCFGPRRTPKASHGEPYAKIGSENFHVVVWRTFCPDDLPGDGESIDHVRSWEKWNNALWNLRKLNQSGQVQNQTRPSGEKQNRRRTPVWGRKDGDAPELREYFHGLNQAARVLNERYNCTNFLGGNINQSARLGCAHNGWRFCYAVTAEEKAARQAERQRVLAAIAALRAAAAVAPSPPTEEEAVESDTDLDEEIRKVQAKTKAV